MSGLAIVEKKPPLNGGGCAGGLLFHLLDWHRRLARKRRIFSPRRLLPGSLRSSPRRLPAPLPSPPPPQPPPALNLPAADGAAPGVVARLMGLESWPGRSAGAPRPQKQRKVEPSSPPDGDAAAVLVLPSSRRPPPAPVAAPAPRSHHGSDLSARSPRRTRLVHAAAAKLLEPGARASSRAGARLAVAYACSSPQHRRDDGNSGASGVADDFLSRSGSMPFERSARFQPPPALPAETERDSAAAVSQRHCHSSISCDDAINGATSSTGVLPRMDFGVANMSKRSSSDVDAVPKERRVRNEGINTCSKVRSSNSSVRAGDERLRKRETPTRPEVSGSVNPVSLASSTTQFLHARELMSAGKRVLAHSSSSPRREFMGSVTRQGKTHCRDVINRLASTSRISGNGPGQKRVSRKNVGRVAAATNTDDRSAVVFASRPSVKPVARASSHSNVTKSGRPSRRASSATNARMPAADPECIEASSSVMATPEKNEFRRLLKAKVNELGMSDRLEFASSDPLSGKLTELQELISALTNDMNTTISQSSNCSYASAPLHSNGNVGCVDQSGYTFSDNPSPSPDFRKSYEVGKDVDSSAASVNDEPNQPSPVSVFEACFSNDSSSSGSPVEKNEGKTLLLSMENKIEYLFNLDSDIVNLAMSTDTTKAGDGLLSCFGTFAAHDFRFLESRLHSIGEALSNVELLLGRGITHSTTSAPVLHPFIMEMLETSVGVFGGDERLGLTEEKYYQHTNFLFDCIVESLDSKFHDFGKCGYKAWLKLPLCLSKSLLKQEVLDVIGSWKESGASFSRVADKELDEVTTSWDACQIEVFDISVAVEDDILEALVVELALDLW